MEYVYKTDAVPFGRENTTAIHGGGHYERGFKQTRADKARGRATQSTRSGSGASPDVARRRKKRRRGSRALHYILITIFLLTAGIVLSLTMFFKIKSIMVIGTDKYPPGDIVAESGIKEGESMFRIDSKTVRERLLAKFAYIETVEVRRKLPGIIRIEITQCIPAGALLLEDEFMFITLEGKVLERGIIFIPENIPLIKGIEAENAKPGDILGSESEEAMRMLDYLFAAVSETGFGEITNVDLTDVYNMKIVYENRLLLNLGSESELPAKLDFLKEMIENRLPKDATGIIDAGNMNRNRRRELIYTEMPIEEALEGRKRPSKINGSTILQNEDKPES